MTLGETRVLSSVWGQFRRGEARLPFAFFVAKFGPVPDTTDIIYGVGEYQCNLIGLGLWPGHCTCVSPPAMNVVIR